MSSEKENIIDRVCNPNFFFGTFFLGMFFIAIIWCFFFTISNFTEKIMRQDAFKQCITAEREVENCKKILQ